MYKNPFSVALGRLGGIARAASMGSDERSKSARKAGRPRAKASTPAQRSKIARKAAKARWSIA